VLPAQISTRATGFLAHTPAETEVPQHIKKGTFNNCLKIQRISRNNFEAS